MLEDMFWKLFQKTGNIEYYLAYTDYKLRQMTFKQNDMIMPYHPQDKKCVNK